MKIAGTRTDAGSAKVRLKILIQTHGVGGTVVATKAGLLSVRLSALDCHDWLQWKGSELKPREPM